MLTREVRILLRKEWRQLRANRTAMLTSVLLPGFFLFVVPQVLMLAAHSERNSPQDHPPPDIGMLGDISHDPSRLAIAMLPLFMTLTGLTLPNMLAVYTIVSERETRTLELLVALPVRIQQVLTAKLLCVLFFTGGIALTLFSIVAIELIAFDLATIGEALALAVLLLAALAYGTASCLVVALLGKDFRTANNIVGALVAPTIVVALALGFVVPGTVLRPLVLAALFLVAAAIIARVALRSITFERLLG